MPSQAGQRATCTTCGQQVKVPGGVAAGAAHSPPPPRAVRGVHASQVTVTCPHCGTPITTDATQESVVCPECLDAVPVPAAESREPGKLPQSANEGLPLSWDDEPEPAGAAGAGAPAAGAEAAGVAGAGEPAAADDDRARPHELDELEELDELAVPDELDDDLILMPAAASPADLGELALPVEIEEFGFLCSVCGTRIVATTAEVGRLKPCPDCHTDCLVPVPSRTSRRTLPGPRTDESDDEYRMAPPVERTGDYGLDTARLEAIGRAAREAAAGEGKQPTTGSQPVAAFPPVPGSSTDRSDQRRPERSDKPRTHADDAWERAEAEARQAERERAEQQLQDVPVWQWATDFLLDMPTLSRLVPLALGLALCVTLIGWAAAWWTEGIGALFSLLFGILAFFVGACVAIAGAVFGQTVVGDTAAGNRRVSNWPDTTFLDWWLDALYVVNSMFLSSLPGLFLGQFLRLLGGPLWLLVLCALASIWVLLPPVLLSMLETNSPVMPVSVPIWTSLGKAPRRWLRFYGMTGGLTLLLFLAMLLLWPQWLLTNLLASAVIVALAMIYFRMLGHLAWSCEEVFAELDEQRERKAKARSEASPRGPKAGD
ncbi:MAG: hypothetical protein J5I93_11760 [Pirellulaceae bacterium]|nr:hypothetical protein [Pirellulaceae bacterium]